MSRKFEMKIKSSREQCRTVVAGVDLLLLWNNCLKRYGDTCISFDESHATNSSHNKIMQQQTLCTEIVTPLRSWRYNMRTYVSKARYRIRSQCLSARVCVCFDEWAKREKIAKGKISSNQGKRWETTQRSATLESDWVKSNWAKMSILSLHKRGILPNFNKLFSMILFSPTKWSSQMKVLVCYLLHRQKGNKLWEAEDMRRQSTKTWLKLTDTKKIELCKWSKRMLFAFAKVNVQMWFYSL